MPRRSNTRASNVQSALSTSPLAHQKDPNSDDLSLLRKQWQWAAFSQFFCTFSQLFALSDVTIADIERDLIHQTNHVISRIMQKMLYSLSYDRKVSVDNWQIALRKQYTKRAPEMNPLGSESKDARHSTREVEGEEVDVLKLGNGLSSQLNGEFNAERVNPTSRAPSATLKSEVDDLVAQERTTRSRQSSIVPNEAGSSDKSVSADDIEEEKLIDWFDLPILSKLQSIHTLAEWQFQNPIRLRTIMKSDDEVASWRIEPIGYDSKRNAYWFIGGNRLWIQRVPPKTPRAKPLKRKRAPEKATQSASPSKINGTSTKRARIAAAVTNTPSLPTSRHSRAAKDQAKLKLDVQARELAELNRQATLSSRQARPTRQTSSRVAQSAKISASRSVGTRASARLRGPQEEEEWQPIPDEWLNAGQSSKRQMRTSAPPKTGLESDQDTVSDLTDLSEEVAESSVLPTSNSEKENGVVKDSNMSDVNEPEKLEHSSSTFVEWETICVTLQEWEHVAEHFEKATHYSEKALYKTLVNDIVPFVTHELREIEHKREMEEALQHRKRSSRLALRESEREEALLASKRKQEEDEKLSRTRRLEARQQREEAERLRREAAREQRRKEREVREESRKNLTAAQEAAKIDKLPKSKSKTSAHENHRTPVNDKGRNGSHSGSRTPAGEDWELDCEICHRRGVNLDDGTPMMSCGRCSKWQHIPCHDHADQAAGRSRRNWDSVEFFCRLCRTSQHNRYRDYQTPVTQQASYHHNAPQMQTYMPYSSSATHSSVDLRAPQYMPLRDTTQQSFYVRPPNNQQLNPPGPYQSTSSHNPSTRPISFNHYQPAAHGFSPGPQKTHTDPHYSYNNSHQHQPHNNHSYQQYSQSDYNEPSQQFRPAQHSQQTAYKSPATNPAWNINVPANAGYQVAHNGALPMPSSSAHRIPANDDQDTHPHSELSLASYSRYPPPEASYVSIPFKHHASYQPPLGR